MSYGDWLTAELSRRRISVRWLALRTGIDHTAILRIRQGRDPRFSTVIALARVIGWPPLDALTELPLGALEPIAHEKALPRR